MEETNNGIVDPSTTQNDTVETTLTVDDYNKLMAEKLELEKKNKQLYARIKKSEEESSDKKTALVETQSSNVDNEKLTRLELKVDHGISDPEAVDFVMKNGGPEALKNPYIKAAVDQILTQKKTEAAIVQEEAGKSEIEKKYTTAQLKSMSSEDLEKILPHA